MNFSHWDKESFSSVAGNGYRPTLGDIYQYSKLVFMREAIFNGAEPAHFYSNSRSLDEGTEAVSELRKYLQDKGGKLVSTVLRSSHTDEDFLVDENSGATYPTDPQSYCYIWPSLCVLLEVGSSGFTFSAASNDKKFLDSLIEVANSFGKSHTSSGAVNVLCARSGGYYISNLGFAGVPFEEGNYTPEVVEKYNRFVNEYNSKSPSGRLVLIEGCPGGGKTYLTRSAISSIKNTKFIIIPSHLVEKLGDPGMIDVLIEDRAYSSKPIVLVVEDADMCLDRRMSDNMSAISSMLNLCDGVLGSLLDVRIIATTNTTVDKMDAALLRPGRLCERISVNKVSAEQASLIYKRITGEVKEFSNDLTLAEIYAAAKVPGKSPELVPAKTRISVGF